MNGGVYTITHIASGRVYVGSSKNVSRRWYEHRRDLRLAIHGNRKLQRAWAKYGADAFAFLIVECVTDNTLLIQREQHWLDAFNASNRKIYNLCPTVANTLGRGHSAATRAIISAKAKERWRSPEYRAACAVTHKGMTGKIASLETRAKISVASRSRNTDLSPEARAQLVATWKPRSPRSPGPRGNGAPFSLERRAKMAAAMKGNKHTLGMKFGPLSAEHGAKVAAANRRRVVSCDTRLKMSLARLGKKPLNGRLVSIA